MIDGDDLIFVPIWDGCDPRLVPKVSTDDDALVRCPDCGWDGIRWELEESEVGDFWMACPECFSLCEMMMM